MYNLMLYVQNVQLLNELRTGFLPKLFSVFIDQMDNYYRNCELF